MDPHLFLTVHSGEESMFYPYAYSNKEGIKNNFRNQEYR